MSKHDRESGLKVDGSRVSALALMRRILDEETNIDFIKDVLTYYYNHGVTAEELSGFTDALQEVAVHVDLGQPVLDLCGTGGDGKNTFNISTTAAFVVAGAGIPVAKHGNSAFSSAIGSSDVLKSLGVDLIGDENVLRSNLERAGICFLHAPLFYPSLKRLAPLRKQLGHPTILNLLGPLLNPARPKYQCLGVKTLDLINLYAEVLSNRGTSYALLHSLDGYDEISLTGDFVVATANGNKVWRCEEVGLSKYEPMELVAPATANQAANLIRDILTNRAPASCRDVVIANAAFAIRTFRGSDASIADAIEEARGSITSGNAFHVLKRLIDGG
jgi:anthranilate phosphoribosyltransferase